jgi:hypothetical protein
MRSLFSYASAFSSLQLSDGGKEICSVKVLGGSKIVHTVAKSNSGKVLSIDSPHDFKATFIRQDADSTATTLKLPDEHGTCAVKAIGVKEFSMTIDSLKPLYDPVIGAHVTLTTSFKQGSNWCDLLANKQKSTGDGVLMIGASSSASARRSASSANPAAAGAGEASAMLSLLGPVAGIHALHRICPQLVTDAA